MRSYKKSFIRSPPIQIRPESADGQMANLKIIIIWKEEKKMNEFEKLVIEEIKHMYPDAEVTCTEIRKNNNIS